MLRTYVTSDTHDKRMSKFVDDGRFDLILHCGDITNRGFADDYGFTHKTINYYKGIKTPMFWTPGNHDIDFGGLQSFGENIERRVVEKDGLTFLGLSLSTCYGLPDLATAWDFMTANPRVEEIYYSDLPYADIVISHSPPRYGTLDLTSDGYEIGSEYLLKYIERVQPRYVFCGHVHKKHRTLAQIGKTEVINLATLSMEIDL